MNNTPSQAKRGGSFVAVGFPAALPGGVTYIPSPCPDLIVADIRPPDHVRGRATMEYYRRLAAAKKARFPGVIPDDVKEIVYYANQIERTKKLTDET